MSVPKKRISKRRTRARRSHHGLSKPSVTECPKCKQPTQPHRACAACGHYRGRDVLKLQAKVEKKISAKSSKKKEVVAETDTPKKSATETKADKKEKKEKKKK